MLLSQGGGMKKPEDPARNSGFLRVNASFNYMLKQAITQIMFLADSNSKSFCLVKQEKINCCLVIISNIAYFLLRMIAIIVNNILTKYLE